MNSKFETLEELDFLGNNHDLKICWIIIFTWQSWQVFWLWTSNRWVLYCVSWLAFCNLPFPFLLLSVISFGICDNHAQQNKKVLQEQLYLKICCQLVIIKTSCNLWRTGMEFLGYSYCSWSFGSYPASILQYKRFKRASWKVITVLLIY